MVTDALIFLIETVAWLFTLALLLRFLLQWARAAPRNAISDFVNALTNFMVKPARRIIPGLWGLDLATLLLAWLVQFVALVLVLQLAAGDIALASGSQLGAIAVMALVRIVRLILYIIIGVVIVQAVLSWVNPYSPVAVVLNALTRPLLRPFQRRIPPVGNVDLSPLFVIVICQLLLIVLSHVR
jgi:YggT family protein